MDFFAHVTLMGSGVLVRNSSSGTSYDWKEGRGGGGVVVTSNGFGVWRREDGAGVNSRDVMITPAGISPSLSMTNDGRSGSYGRAASQPGKAGFLCMGVSPDHVRGDKYTFWQW